MAERYSERLPKLTDEELVCEAFTEVWNAGREEIEWREAEFEVGPYKAELMRRLDSGAGCKT